MLADRNVLAGVRGRSKRLLGQSAAGLERSRPREHPSEVAARTRPLHSAVTLFEWLRVRGPAASRLVRVLAGAALVLFLVVRVPGAELTPTPVFAEAGAKSALMWSPTGEALGFLHASCAEAHLRVYIVADGTTADLGAASGFAWAPEGKALAIWRPGKPETIVLRAWPDGQDQEICPGTEPVFAKDGKAIGFVREGQAFLVALSGGPSKPLSGKAMIQTHLSPGAEAFFLTGDGSLWRTKADGTGVDMVLRNAGMGADPGGLEYYIGLAVSPDAQRIVLVSSGAQDAGGAPTSLLLVDSHGGGKVQLGPGRHPAWAPDGSALVYAFRGNLYWYAIKTAAKQQLTANPAAQYSWPAWAPDGKRIAFCATLTDTNGDGKVDWRDAPGIYVMDTTRLSPAWPRN